MRTMTPGSKPESELELTTDQGTEKLVLIGPSLHGCIYRQSNGDSCYRRLPIAQAPLALRNAVDALVGAPAGPGIARITWDGQPNPGYFWVRYEVPQFEVTLADVLGDADPRCRFDGVVRVIRALPGWWRDLYSPIVPMPADVAFSHDMTPHLLAMPQWRFPDAEAVFAEPERLLYLAPEFVRNDREQRAQSVDLYALGAALIQCFYEPPKFDDPADMLLRAASGVLYERTKLTRNVPFWYDRVWAARQAVEAAWKLVSPKADARGVVAPADLADLLTSWSAQMDPKAAAIQLRDNTQTLDAFALLQDALMTDESYDLLVLAGEIAGQYLRRTLEAIDFFERAIARESYRPEAREGQFRAIATGRHSDQLAMLMARDSPAGVQMDTRIQRDYDAMSTEKQNQYELNMAEYLLWRRQYDAAARFIHPRLFDGQGNYQWWKFQMNIAYAEALIGLQAYDQAQKALAGIRQALEGARARHSVDEREYRSHAQNLADLEMRLYKLTHP